MQIVSSGDKNVSQFFGENKKNISKCGLLKSYT